MLDFCHFYLELTCEGELYGEKGRLCCEIQSEMAKVGKLAAMAAK